MNKLKDIISPGHRELDEILYNNPKKTPSPQQTSPKRSSLSQRVRSVRRKDKGGSPDAIANASTTNPPMAGNVAPPPALQQQEQQQHPIPAEQYAVPEEAVSKTDQIYAPQPIHPPKRLDTPKHLATPEEELEEGQFGQVNSGRPTYLAATKQVPSEIASVASIKSGTTGYPVDATSVSREATPRGFARDDNLMAHPPTNTASSQTQDRNWVPAGVAAGAGAAGVGAAAYSHHQRHDRDNIHNQDSYDSSQNGPVTAATYSPADHSDNLTHPYNPAGTDAPTPTEASSWERPSLMPGTYVSENDIKHSQAGSASHTTGPHKSKLANILDPRVKRNKGTGKSTHEADVPNRVVGGADSNPAHVHNEQEAAPQGHHGKEAAMAAGAVGLAGAGVHHASQSSRATDHRDGYERQTSPYSSAPLDPRVDTTGRASNPHNVTAAPAYDGDVSPMAPTFSAGGTASATYRSNNAYQSPHDTSSPPISPVSQQERMIPEQQDPAVAAGHSRFDSVQEAQFPDDRADMAAFGGVETGRPYSRGAVERADKKYREEYQLYQKELARDQTTEDKELEAERRTHEKQLAKEQKQIDKDMLKSQKEHTKQMQKEAKQIQKEMERQENGGKKKRRSGLFGFLHKDKHAHEHDAATSGDAYGSSSEEARYSGDSGRQERHRLAKPPPAGHH